MKLNEEYLGLFSGFRKQANIRTEKFNGLTNDFTFVFSLVSLGHDFPASTFRKQHNTDLSVRLCLDSYLEKKGCVEGFEYIKQIVELEIQMQVTLTLGSISPKSSTVFWCLTLSVPLRQL